MWTRPQIKDFKEKIRQDPDSVITVGRGEVVTVRVPTHEEGSYLFWEFATDYYDIGFGVFFEWTDAASASVSVHVSESSDEDEEEEGKGFLFLVYFSGGVKSAALSGEMKPVFYFCSALR